MRIYTEINWRWTESGLEEEVSSSTQYCGDLSLCGGDSNGGGSSSTDTSTSTSTPTPTPKPKPKRQYGYSPGDPRFGLPTPTPPPTPPPPTTTTAPELTVPKNTEILTDETNAEKMDRARKVLRETGKLPPDLDTSFYKMSLNVPTGTGGDTTGSADPVPETTTTTTVTTPAPAPEESTIEEEDPDVEQTIGDELAMRKVRRRLRDRFGRRATRGGGAEMAGTGYRLGG